MAAYSSIPMFIFPGHTFPPLQVFIEVTYSCNLRCDFCQFLMSAKCDYSPKKNLTELSNEEFRLLIDNVPRHAIISFSGGEPFMKKHFVDLLAQASRRNKTNIFTNATLITQGQAERLIRLGAKSFVNSGLVLIGVSLEGLQQTHSRITQRSWAFDRTIAGVEALIHERSRQGKKYPLIELKAVISNRNISELHELFLIAKRLKVDIFNVMAMNMLPQANRLTAGKEISCFKTPPPVEKIDRALLHHQLKKIKIEALESEIQLRTTPQGFDLAEIINYYDNGLPLRGYRCYYPWYGLSITAYGDLLLCPYSIIGNVRESNIKQLINHSKARKFRRQLKRQKTFPGCWGCCMLVPDGSSRPSKASTKPDKINGNIGHPS